MNDLKPCPFCGGVAKLNAPGYEYYSPCWCKCTRCGAEGPTKSSELEAEKGWDERAQESPAIDAVPGVWCKDCKFGTNGTGDDNVTCTHVWHKNMTHRPDWFCADGERRDDDGLQGESY